MSSRPAVLGLAIALTFLPGTGRAAEEEIWWSLRPLVRPQVPEGRAGEGGRTPIDRFILAKLQEMGLSPSPETDKRTLLRRVTFDLIGLPPTPEEIDAFLRDNSPNAYEKVVDRLLRSPHYGERWARHWMDIAHYAETHGHDQDRPRPNAWHYRDYLIRSFNSDKPYARFVREQIAGDVLWPEDSGAVTAMGFLATGPWDESSLRDIRDDSIDRQIARYIDRDDMVTTAMSTFISSTVHCARCHDHKFDPISQQDYYALQAVFAGVDKGEHEYDADPRVGAKRKHLLAQKAHLQKSRERKGPGIDSMLLTAEVQAEVDAWEKKVAASVISWSPLDPHKLRSTGGATLTKQSDLSVLSSGNRPETDTVTLTADTNLQNITGIRLEVLTDDSLPHKGPGRQDNGNLHLNEFKVSLAPKGAADSEAKWAVLKNAAADFNQDGWTVAMAIDGDSKTAWGIYPNVGRPHRAVFEFDKPFGFKEGTALSVVLDQTHGGGHLIGRMRISVTTAPQPLTAVEALPDSLVKILSVSAAKRTDKQKAELARHVLEQHIDRQLAALPPMKVVYAATSDFKPDGSFRPAGKPREVHMLKRGDISKPGPEAKPGALECVPGLEARFRLADSNNEGSRRVALADWIADPKNPLTWRSIVNRVWHYHFGKGIVDTPNDFGRMGAKPTHPELLDWLAVSFQEHGGSLKWLHRLIVTSAVYRQSSRHDSRFAEIDGDNRYLWRMNRIRLDAEEVRDAVLLAAGKLDRTVGGPSVKQFNMSPGIHVTPVVDYTNFDLDRRENYRRSVYRFVFRTLPDPLMEALDCPDSSQLTPARTVSVTPLQALAMLNNRFIVRMSEHLAERAAKESPDLPAQICAVYRFALDREPTAKEGAALDEYARKHGLANACRVILNSNEFMFVN
jgi:hypothetical protein